jgi:mannonate dehydratase
MGSGYPMKHIKGLVNTKPGIQVGTKWQGAITKNRDGSFAFDPEGVQFLQQIGVEWVMIHDPPAHTAAEMRQLKKQVEDLGFRVFRLADNRLHNMSEITLNLPGRDKLIDEYLQYITNLGEAGIHYSTYAHMGNGIWSDDERRPLRGGALARGLDLENPNRGHWRPALNRDQWDPDGSGVFDWPLSHGRKYSEAELWDNYEYFIKKVVPVAESAGVYIGVHPDDPPGVEMAGIPRKIFGTLDGYKRALEIAASPNIGACLCVGCWLEGGESLCGTPEEFIRYLGPRGKLFKIHMRNVSAPLSSPEGFTESFPDDGYYNLINIIEALDEVEFDGVIMNDHLVNMVGGRYACEADFTAYLKGAVDAVQNHRKTKKI